MPAALFGGLAVFAVFLLGRELTDSSMGAIAALFLVFAPGAFHQFVNGNAYRLLMLLAALSTWFLWRAVRSDGLADWLGYVFFALLGLATHTLFAMYILAQAAAGLWLRAKQGGARFGRPVPVFGSCHPLAVLFTLWRSGAPASRSRAADTSPSALHGGDVFRSMSEGPRIQLVLWCLLQVAGAALLFRGMAGFFANTNPIVARITEAGVRRPDAFVEQFTEKMRLRHLRVEQPARFYKVIVLLVTRE